MQMTHICVEVPFYVYICAEVNHDCGNLFLIVTSILQYILKDLIDYTRYKSTCALCPLCVYASFPLSQYGLGFNTAIVHIQIPQVS